MRQKRLKRCPFCGSRRLVLHGSALFSIGFGIQCNNCGAEAAKADTQEKARQRWNRRAGGVQMAVANAYFINTEQKGVRHV